jgi:uncharacterized protein YkuJ
MMIIIIDRVYAFVYQTEKRTSERLDGERTNEREGEKICTVEIINQKRVNEREE